MVRAMGVRRRRDSGLAREVVATAQGVSRAGLVTGTVGNVSARVRDGMLITPSRTRYEAMHERDVAFVDDDGRAHGRLAPSTEWPLHLAIYRARTDVRAVIHTHSLHATAWSFRGGGSLPEIEELRYYGIGTVAVSTPVVAGTAALGAAAVDALGDAHAVLLGEHGVVAVGPSLGNAVIAADVVERQAAIAWLLEGSEVLRP
jgi:L-ribulose-5-phosphate 4-epimerase